MLRASDYNIYIPLNNEDMEYLLVHGYTGAVDVVSEDVFNSLSNCTSQENSRLDEISEEDLNGLKERGYVTEKKSDEEKAIFKRVAGALLKHLNKKELHVTLVPTYNCNFRCVYCFEQGVHKNKKSLMEKVMSESMVDEIFIALDKAKEDGYSIADSLILFGGEPLLGENREIVEYIVNKARERGQSIMAVTNGYDLDTYEDYLSIEKIGAVQITIDGMEEFHNKRRFLKGKKDTFKKIVDNIDLCISRNINVNLRTNVDGENINQLPLLLEFYDEKGWNEKQNFSFHFTSVQACNLEDKKNMFNDTIMENLIEKYDAIKLMEYIPFYSDLAKAFLSVLESGQFALYKPFFCGANSGLITIDPERNIYPCWEVIGEEKDKIGHISNGKIEFNENLNYWRERNVSTMEECIDCPYALFCGGNCASQARIHGGDIYSSNCENFKEIFHNVFALVYKDFVKEKKLLEV